MAEEEHVPVRDRAGIGAARRVVRSRALAIGFEEHAADELALVATELASNLVKHAEDGQVSVATLESASGSSGIRIESHDYGPGLGDIDHAVADGVSSSGTLGYGLGTVHRLMDEVEISSEPELERGTRIVAVRWLRERGRTAAPLPISFGAAARPRPGSSVNGDTYLIRRWGVHALVAVIDGLGHGQFALRASRTARDYVERHHDAPIDRIFAGANRACRGTRGVVMALARFDLSAGTLSFGSIGNIEARMRRGPDRVSLFVRRGVVGLNAPPARIEEYTWGPDSLLVMHSDGLHSHWTWDDNADLAELPAMDAARRLFNRAVRRNDDAVVVVVRGEADAPAAAMRPAPEAR